MTVLLLPKAATRPPAIAASTRSTMTTMITFQVLVTVRPLGQRWNPLPHGNADARQSTTCFPHPPIASADTDSGSRFPLFAPGRVLRTQNPAKPTIMRTRAMKPPVAMNVSLWARW
jgi:hypothetical protein